MSVISRPWAQIYVREGLWGALSTPCPLPCSCSRQDCWNISQSRPSVPPLVFPSHSPPWQAQLCPGGRGAPMQLPECHPPWATAREGAVSFKSAANAAMTPILHLQFQQVQNSMMRSSAEKIEPR